MSWDPVDLSDILAVEVHRKKRGWGGWTLDTANRVLYADPPERYEIALDECDTSAEVLDWICQIAGKPWATDSVLAGLVRALDDILRPQENLCSWGRSSRLKKAEIKALVAEWPE